MPVLPLIDCLTATVFLALSVVSLVDRRRPHRMWQSARMILTALWAAAFAWPALEPAGFPGEVWADLFGPGLDVGRFAVWYLALLLLIDPRRLPDRAGLGRRITIAGALAVAAVVLLLDISPVIGVHRADDTLWASAGLIGHLAFAVTGLMIVENVWRNARGDRIWSVKFLLLAVGSICAFDFYLYADALLFNRLDPDLFAARPLVALDQADQHGVDQNVVRRALPGQHFRQREAGGARDRGRGAGRARRLGADVEHVDDTAPAPLLHLRPDEPREADGAEQL